MKYQRLILDGLYGFEQHFANVIPRVDKMAASLGRLLPNVGRTQRSYATAMQSVSLYGAPVWVGRVAASRKVQAIIHRLQRWLAVRNTRSYRTASYVANTALAGVIPAEYLENLYAEVYRRMRDPNHPESACLRPGVLEKIKKEARRRVILEWQVAIDSSATGRWTAHAIQPSLPEWVDKRRRGFWFHLTQVLTGHGCFDEYLHRIGREHTTQCHHCAADRDSALHTLTECET